MNTVCKNCDGEFTVEVTLPTPETGRWGPPENYDPGDGGEVWPGECPHCGAEVDWDGVFEDYSEDLQSRREAAAEDRADALREERYARQ